ncbi:hypothetical protein [Amycolatopsis sp. WQ 127309]|uniref:hypothetical protein n=1 Tax=Amycolatopsis sp. WQ 127309 TaxID=2932773 RepID=UPI001FF303F5|nr:hypothetical protein [Amycolatopsis sp. WQ 127309]UOZ10659.1 hypothetical protein MUY22_21305 [Amycolatopsis sp. WQ 127309]
MRNNVIRALTVLATTVSVALAGVGTASAGGPGGSGSSSTTSAASTVQQLRDQLSSRADNGNLPGVRSTIGELDPLLTDLTQGKRYTVQTSARNSAATAKQENTEARQGVDKLATQLEPRQSLPPVAGLLNALLQRLLLSLSVLVNDLLGGLTVLPIG